MANADDVTDWEGGKRLVDTAIEAFGDLHVLVNNAGILRDRVLVNMSEHEWDAVIHVHLKGHFVPTRHAAAYWREQTKAGNEVKASVVNTSSTSGLLGNPGQTNYGAAKAGIAAFTTIAAARALPLRGPGQRHRPGGPHPDDRADPRPLRYRPAPGRRVGLRQLGPGQRLAAGGLPRHRVCPATGKVFFVQGGADPPVPALDDDRHDREGRPLDGGGAPGGDAPARRLSGVPVRRARPIRGCEASIPARRIEAEAMLSGTGAGAEGGIVVPWPLLFRHRMHHRVARFGPLPVVGAVDGAGRTALGQHHLHRLRGGPARGGPPAPHVGVHPHLDVDRPTVGLRGGRPRSSANWGTCAATAGSTCGGCPAPPSAWSSPLRPPPPGR